MEATTSSFRYLSRVVTSADIVLTPVILLGALKNLPTAVIECAVEALISELDYRGGDPDLEACVEEDSC